MRQHFVAVFISPHLDDAVFSCAGTIARLVADGPVVVVNVFSRYPADVHRGPVRITRKRFDEETKAAALLGFTSVCLDETDAALRHPAYASSANLFRPPVAEDIHRLGALAGKITDYLSSIDYDSLYLPLGIGWHVDHLLCHLATKELHLRPTTFFYEDSPYCLIPHATRYRVSELGMVEDSAIDRTLTTGPFVVEWYQACRAYAGLAPIARMEPWPLRGIACLVVSLYLGTLLYQHRQLQKSSNSQHRLKPLLIDIGADFLRKIEGCYQYDSQINEFFVSEEDCVRRHQRYSKAMTDSLKDEGNAMYERFWTIEPVESIERWSAK
jgi:LmbE family N-acetylglucosaminyl deacetylase